MKTFVRFLFLAALITAGLDSRTTYAQSSYNTLDNPGGGGNLGNGMTNISGPGVTGVPTGSGVKVTFYANGNIPYRGECSLSKRPSGPAGLDVYDYNYNIGVAQGDTYDCYSVTEYTDSFGSKTLVESKHFKVTR